MITFIESYNKNKLIAEGGEGRIYKSKSRIIKIFKVTVDLIEKQKKIKSIMKLKLPSTVVSPIDLICDANNEFIGYSMKNVKGDELSMLSSRKYIRSNNITKKDILEILTKIETTLKTLHTKNIFIGDLSDLNILFNGTDVYFIDVDSWSFGKYQCTVANDGYRDPLLKKNYFSSDTDVYAFAIMVYKSLTRLHPFGGAYQPNVNMSLRERMDKRISAIDNDNVKIPRMVDKDVFMSQSFKDNLKEIYETDLRKLTGLTTFHDDLKYCNDHKDYYYGRFNKCPVCESDAQERLSFVNIGQVDGVPIRVLFQDPNIKIIFTENVYLGYDNRIYFRNAKKSIPFQQHRFYFTNKAGDVYYKVSKVMVHIKLANKELIKIKKKHNTGFNVNDNDIFYISPSFNLMKFTLFEDGHSYTKRLEKVATNNVFTAVSSDDYFICNSYDSNKIINISGHNYIFNNKSKIINHTIQQDPISKKWLFIFETSSNRFHTMILNQKDGILYHQDDIRYTGNLNNMCFYNSFIYKPKDNAIVRFNYKSNEYKEFKIPIVSTETKLVKYGKRFRAINEDMIFEIG